MKLFICLIGVLFSLSSSYAQDKWKVGAMGGANLSNYFGKDIDRLSINGNSYESSFSSLLGIHANLFLEYRVSNRISVQPEIMYLLNGYTRTPRSNYTLKFTIREGYVLIPVYFNYFLMQKNNFQTKVQVGYVLGRNIDEYYALDDSPQSTKGFAWKGLEQLFSVGLTHAYHVGFGELLLSFRYYRKLNQNVLDINGNKYRERYQIYNLNLGYAIPIH